jgi:hypothetical protein
MNPKATERRKRKLKTRTASLAVALGEEVKELKEELKKGQIVGGNARTRFRRRGLNGLMAEMESLSIDTTAEPAITPPRQRQGTMAVCKDQLRKGDRLTSTPANAYFHRVSPSSFYFEIIYPFSEIQASNIVISVRSFSDLTFVNKYLLRNTLLLRGTSTEN